MLVISAGMQKSGSAYFYNIINELLVASRSGADARDVKQNRGLDYLMKWHNNNIGVPTFYTLFRLWRTSVQDGAFVVKTHEGPTISLWTMDRLGLLRTVYCYRDPRDVLLSAIDHGKKILAEGQNHTFAKLVEFEDALQATKRWIRIWNSYADMPQVLTVRYEDMMQDSVNVTKRIENFLGVSVEPEKRQEILWRYSKDNPECDRQGMHFNKPTTFRYITEMTKEQKAMCRHAFGASLKAMGYDVE